MKTCFKCGELKPLREFYAHPKMRDGTLNKCKVCAKKDAANHYKQIAQDPHWVAKERLRQRKKERRRRSEGLVEAYPSRDMSSWRKLNPEKAQAYNRVNYAIRYGKLLKQPCEVCGCSKVQAHHDDYSRPLDVRWLCVKHHNEHHVKQRAALLFQGVN
jgi:ribosomal protein S27AE